jgi:hypothetical protein
MKNLNSLILDHFEVWHIIVIYLDLETLTNVLLSCKKLNKLLDTFLHFHERIKREYPLQVLKKENFLNLKQCKIIYKKFCKF